MKKTLLSLVMLLCAGTLFATPGAVGIGTTRNGYPLIIPQVKELKPAHGLFALPKKLTVAAPAGLDLVPFGKVYAQTVKGGEAVRITDAEAALRFVLTLPRFVAR